MDYNFCIHDVQHYHTFQSIFYSLFITATNGEVHLLEFGQCQRNIGAYLSETFIDLWLGSFIIVSIFPVKTMNRDQLEKENWRKKYSSCSVRIFFLTYQIGQEFYLVCRDSTFYFSQQQRTSLGAFCSRELKLLSRREIYKDWNKW